MKTTTLTLSNKSIDKFSILIDSFLHDNDISSKDIALGRLLIEDTLIKYQKHFGEKTPCRFESKVTKNGCAFMFYIQGEEHDLLIHDKNDELTLLSNFIEQSEHNLSYSYLNGENVLKCAFHKDVRHTLYKFLRMVGVPIAIWTLIHALSTSLNTLMVAFTGPENLSAIALCTKITEFYEILLTIILYGASNMITGFWGRKDKDSVEQVFGLSARISFFIGLFFTIITACFPGFIMDLLTDNKYLLSIGKEYLRLYSPFYILSAISEVGLILVHYCGKSKIMLMHSLWLFVASIPINLILIYGIGSFDGLGFSGAATTSTIIAVAECLLVISEFTEGGWLQFKLKYFFKVSKNIKRLFRTHILWGGISGIAVAVSTLVFSSAVGHMSDLNVIAGYSLATTIASFASFAYKGLSDSGSMIMGYEQGRHHLHKIRVYGKTLVHLSVIIGVVTALALLITAYPISMLHDHLGESAQSSFLITTAMYAVYLFFSSIAATLDYAIFWPSIKLKTSCVVNVISYWLLSTIPGLICIHVINASSAVSLGVFLSSSLFSSIIFYVIYKRYKWVPTK